MTQPTPSPVAPVPVTPPLIEPPVLTSASWWTWAATTAVSLAIGVGTLVGHPFSSDIADAIIPSFAMLAASIATAFQLHGIHTVTAAKLAYLSSVHYAQIEGSV